MLGAQGRQSATEDGACTRPARGHAPTPHHGEHALHRALRAQRLRHVGQGPATRPRAGAFLGTQRTQRAFPETLSRHRLCAQRAPGGARTTVPVRAAAVGLTDVRTGGHTASVTPTPKLGLGGGCRAPSFLPAFHVLGARPSPSRALGPEPSQHPERASGHGGLSGLM